MKDSINPYNQGTRMFTGYIWQSVYCRLNEACAFPWLHVPFINSLKKSSSPCTQSCGPAIGALRLQQRWSMAPPQDSSQQQCSTSAPLPVHSSAWHLWEQKMDCFQDHSGLAQLRIKACSQTPGGGETTASHFSLLETRILRLQGCQFGSVYKSKWMITGKRFKQSQFLADSV